MLPTKAKAQAQDLAEMKKQSKGLPVFANATPQSIKPRYLGIYNEFFCTTNQPGFFNADEAYRRKIGALRKHRINKYHLRIEKETGWEDKSIVFEHLKQFKRLQQVSFYMGRKGNNSGMKLPLQTEILQSLLKILYRLPRLSNVQLVYPYKLIEIRTFRKLRKLDHITLGMHIGHVLKEEKGLVKLLSRDFRHNRVNSATLICYAAPGAATKAKKSTKGKKVLKPSDCLSPKFNHLTQLQKLSIQFRDITTFELFEPLLADKTFLQLKRLNIQLPGGGFSIENKNETILDPALLLMRILNGKPPKKILASNGAKPEITIRGYENALKNYAETISALGRVSSVAIKNSRSEKNELAQMFSHLKDLKSISLSMAGWEVSEVFQGIRNLHCLTDLEVHSGVFSSQIYAPILQHSATLTKLSMSFNNANDTAAIMNYVLQLPNLTIFHLDLGDVRSYKKGLRPLRDLTQLKRLTELEITGSFDYDENDAIEVGMEFAEILKNLKGLRWLSIRATWDYEAWYNTGHSKEQWTAILNELQVLRRLKGLFVDLTDHPSH